MGFDVSATPNDDLLLRLFKKSIISELEAQLKEAIRPKIEEAAQEAMKSLETYISSQYNALSDKQVFSLVVKVNSNASK